MPNPFYHRAAIDRLLRLSEKPNPAHVRLAAVSKLINATRPGYPGNQPLLEAHPYEFARHKLRDLYDRSDSVLGTQSRVTIDVTSEDDETTEESEDPL